MVSMIVIHIEIRIPSVPKNLLSTFLSRASMSPLNSPKGFNPASEGRNLAFCVDFAVNATKLFLISQDKPEPTYSVEIFPKIPSAEEVTTAEQTIESDYTIYIVIGGLLAAAIIAVIIFKIIKRKKLL